MAAGVSYYGDWLSTVAIVVLVFRATGSVTAPVLYMLARVAPRVLGPTVGGSLADRFDPARVASICAFAQGALTGSIVLVAQVGAIWAVFLLVVGAQFLNSLAQPAYGALIPRLASPEDLGRANGILTGLFASSMLVSPAIGALVLPRTTPEVLIAIDAGTFLVAALLFLTIRVTPSRHTVSGRTDGAAAGMHVVSREAVLRSAAAGLIGNTAAITALQAVLVVAATQHFGRDIEVGWLYAAVGAGGLLGSVAFLGRATRRVHRRGIVIFSAGELAAFSAFVFVLNLPLACLLLFISSLSSAVYYILGSIALQQRTPIELLGRTTGVMRSAMYIGMLIGAIAALALVQPLGWEATVLIVCAGAFVLLIVATVTGPRPALASTPLSDIPE